MGLLVRLIAAGIIGYVLNVVVTIATTETTYDSVSISEFKCAGTGSLTEGFPVRQTYTESYEGECRGNFIGQGYGDSRMGIFAFLVNQLFYSVLSYGLIEMFRRIAR